MAVKMDQATKRRVRAGRLLLKGKVPPEVARAVGAPRHWKHFGMMRCPRVAHPGRAGLLQPETRVACDRAQRGCHGAVEEARVAGTQKKTCRDARVIVFIDESSLSERPMRIRTWALRGQTLIIQFHFNWKQLSMIAGVSFTSAYLRLPPGTIKNPQIVTFLKALVAQIKQPLLVIRYGLRAHSSRMVRDYVDTLDGGSVIALLPPYAPELNPVEYLWAWFKRHALVNYCPNSITKLAQNTRGKLRSVQLHTS